MITVERMMVEPTARVENVEMTWTRNDQETVGATYGQELAGVAGSPEDGLEPASDCGQGDSLEREDSHRLDEIEMDAQHSFLAASTSVTARLNRELEAGCGISMHKHGILVHLSETPEQTLRMSTLAKHVSHSRSRPVRTVQRLESVRYVGHSSCDSDRRDINCMLTLQGLNFLREAAPVHFGGVRRHVVGRPSREQQVALAKFMKVTAQASDPSCGLSVALAPWGFCATSGRR